MPPMKSKYNLQNFKKKISNTNMQSNEAITDKFDLADNLLQDTNQKKLTESKIIRKTFSIPEDEICLFHKIKQNAIKNHVVLSNSEIIRLGLLITSSLSPTEIESNAKNLQKMQMGRPKKQ